MLLNRTDLPVKHSDSSPDEPPKAIQKSDSDCQRSVSLEEEEDGGGTPVPLPCSDGAKGEFDMDLSLQVSQSCVQKSLALSLACVELDETVELQSIGTVRSFGPGVKRSAENGLHLAQRTD